MKLKTIFLFNLRFMSSIKLMGISEPNLADSIKTDSKTPKFDIHSAED